MATILASMLTDPLRWWPVGLIIGSALGVMLRRDDDTHDPHDHTPHERAVDLLTASGAYRNG